MAIIQRRTAPISSTDAQFRAWGSAFKALIEVGGFWQKASDSGQIDWTTVAHPTGNNAIQGYEMYVTVDALAAQFSLYMKVEYMGAPTAVNGHPSFRLSWATQTDGAGTLLGGNVSSSIRHQPDNNAPTAAEISNEASGGPGYWGLLGWRDFVDGPNNIQINSFGVSVGRSVNTAGAFTSDYISVFASFTNANSNGPQFFQTIWNPTKGKVDRSFSFGYSFTAENSFGATSDGTDAIAFALFPFIGFLDNPLLNIMGLMTQDAKNGSIADIIIYGQSRKYLFAGCRWSAGAFHTPKIYDLGGVDKYIRMGILWQ